MPPAPAEVRISYRPSLVPEVSPICARNYSLAEQVVTGCDRFWAVCRQPLPYRIMEG
jgi:hypothetical protein